MKTKVRLCRLLCSKLLLLTVFCSLGLLECLRWLQQPQAPRQIQPPETRDLQRASDELPGVPTANPPGAPGSPKTPPAAPKTPPAAPARRPPAAPRKTRLLAARKILLLAYARSGSSFTGELLSALPRAAYYYEPLFR